MSGKHRRKTGIKKGRGEGGFLCATLFLHLSDCDAKLYILPAQDLKTDLSMIYTARETQERKRIKNTCASEYRSNTVDRDKAVFKGRLTCLRPKDGAQYQYRPNARHQCDRAFLTGCIYLLGPTPPPEGLIAPDRR